MRPTPQALWGRSSRVLRLLSSALARISSNAPPSLSVITTGGALPFLIVAAVRPGSPAPPPSSRTQRARRISSNLSIHNSARRFDAGQRSSPVVSASNPFVAAVGAALLYVMVSSMLAAPVPTDTVVFSITDGPTSSPTPSQHAQTVSNSFVLRKSLRATPHELLYEHILST